MLRAVALAFIAVWRRGISPFLPPACRFHPSCSLYAAEAIKSVGVARGSYLTLRRLARCHPFHPGGLDLPPSREV